MQVCTPQISAPLSTWGCLKGAALADGHCRSSEAAVTTRCRAETRAPASPTAQGDASRRVCKPLLLFRALMPISKHRLNRPGCSHPHGKNLQGAGVVWKDGYLCSLQVSGTCPGEVSKGHHFPRLHHSLCASAAKQHIHPGHGGNNGGAGQSAAPEGHLPGAGCHDTSCLAPLQLASEPI